jgi:thioredoxin-like negative regulator of GroEL
VRTVAEKLAGKAAVVQIDTQKNPALAARFGIRGIPDIVLLRSGKIVSRLAGSQSVEAVLAWFRQHHRV